MKTLTILAALTLGLSAGVYISAPAPAHAQEDDILKKAINSPGVANYQIFGSVQTNAAIKDETVQGGDARRVIISKAGANPWDAAAQMPITGKITKGDEIVTAIWLKAAATENGAAGTVTLRLQQSGAPYTGLVQKTITLKPTWELYSVTATSADTYPKGTANFAVQLAHAAQTIDIGPAFVLNMGPKKPAS
ncbi:hypothetical protein [Asticcacaulis endophyticus]|uniref:Carbohydrate binding domain-containing protein n=1 Tax=Asticcacaulis endophyticus TaxID=1395890 RepID=A0A918QGK7_9CAUL|nr:hypothetical protein [Asticcacaulis endophyticus]GGZ44361.1 hypothetical protein GCM10011273_33880 [Asticcacaulis endophyticus]